MALSVDYSGNSYETVVEAIQGIVSMKLENELFRL